MAAISQETSLPSIQPPPGLFDPELGAWRFVGRNLRTPPPSEPVIPVWSSAFTRQSAAVGPNRLKANSERGHCRDAPRFVLVRNSSFNLIFQPFSVLVFQLSIQKIEIGKLKQSLFRASGPIAGVTRLDHGDNPRWHGRKQFVLQRVKYRKGNLLESRR